MIDPMLVVCHKLAAASSILNDGPDESDASMAANYVIEATEIAKRVVYDERNAAGQPYAKEEAAAILTMLHMSPDEVFNEAATGSD